MTYGVYSADLKGVSLSGVSIETARKCLYGGKVICSEKRIKTGFEITFTFKWRYLQFRFKPRLDDAIQIGPLEIGWRALSYIWADKIVEEGGEK